MWRQIIWDRTPGYYLFYTSLVYLAIGMYCVFVDPVVNTDRLQVAWISVLVFPFVCPPLGRYFNLDVTWDQKMFNFFSKKDKGNIVDFPELKSVPQVQPPKKEEPAKTYYRLGLTSDNRVSFTMGYNEITMNYHGCQQMIDQLTFFQSQLYDDSPDGGPDGDGGEPIPVPEQKAA